METSGKQTLTKWAGRGIAKSCMSKWAALATFSTCALLAGSALAKSGPILPERTPDYFIDNFEGETPGFKVIPGANAGNCAVERLSTGGRFGEGCLQMTFKRPANVGCAVSLSWKFKEPIDLSAYDEIVLFYKSDKIGRAHV